MEKVGTESFARLRIGIGHDFRGAAQGAEYVLGRFEGEEKELIDAVTEKAAEAVMLILHRGLSFAMNSFNKMDLSAREEKQEKSEEDVKENTSEQISNP